MADLLFLSAYNDGGIVDTKKSLGRIDSLLNTALTFC